MNNNPIRRLSRLLLGVGVLLSAVRAGAYDFKFIMGTDCAYVSPDIPSRLHFFSAGKGEFRGAPLVLELPEGIEPVGACSRSGTAIAPSAFAKWEPATRGTAAYRRYQIPLPGVWRAQAYVYLGTSLKPGTKTTAYYWTVTDGKPGAEHALPVEIVSVHKVKNVPKRLFIGQGWEGREVFEAWPGFEKDYPALGLRFISLTDGDIQSGPSERARAFVTRCTNAGIRVSATVSPGSHMGRCIKGDQPADALARTSEGEVFRNGGATSLCPSYRGDVFDQALIQPLRNIAANGISMAAFDYELGFGSMDGNGGNNYICFCDRCLEGFRKHLKEKHPGLAYVDPRVFEPLFEKYPELHEAWREFMSDQIAGWFRIEKAAFVEACQKSGAKSTPEVWLHDYGTPPTWETAHVNLFFPPKNLTNGLDFIGPTYYDPGRPKTAMWKARCMHDGSRSFNYKGRNLWPWMTAGYSDKANSTPDELRSTFLLAFASGLQGMIFYDGTAIDARDFDTISRVIDLVAPLEDLIVDGEFLSAECDLKSACAYGQKLGRDIFLVVGEFGEAPARVNVRIPVEAKSDVFDLATGAKLATISPAANMVAVAIDRQRAVPLQVKAAK